MAEVWFDRESGWWQHNFSVSLNTHRKTEKHKSKGPWKACVMNQMKGELHEPQNHKIFGVLEFVQ